MPDDRPGGPIYTSFERAGAGVALRFSDASSGGGMVLHFPTAARAQLWLDDLEGQLAEVETHRVFG
jgi:hypothetical protein